MSFLKASVAAALAMSATLASAQGTSSSVEERLQRLEAEQAAMRQQLAERDGVIQELKREVGQKLNELKQKAQDRYNSLKTELESTDESATENDLTRPAFPYPSGSYKENGYLRFYLC